MAWNLYGDALTKSRTDEDAALGFWKWTLDGARQQQQVFVRSGKNYFATYQRLYGSLLLAKRYWATSNDETSVYK